MYYNYTKKLLIMSRNSFLAIFIVCLCGTMIFANDGNSQSSRLHEMYINIEEETTSLKKVFETIERQTGFEFSYFKSVLKNDKLNLQLSAQENLGILLNKISEASKLSFKRVNDKIYISKHSKDTEPTVEEINVRDVDITGKITDENGEGLPGASVVVKGTSQGTTTDIEGNYKLTAPDEAILTISFVGYITREVAVGGRSTIDTQLVLDAAQLDEVVVVGYGTQKKANVTGAIVDIDSEELNQSSVANLSNALVGRLPGLIATQRSGQPGANASTLLIRGVGTTGNSSPLVIVDGVQRDFSQLNPNEIESITILKDASAAAIYGVRGANGVILVTTKRGKEGKPTISYSSEFTTQKPTRLPKFLDSYNYAVLFNEAKRNEGKSELFTQDDLNKYQSGSNPETHPNTDWLAEGLENSATMAQHNLSVQGGSDKVNYFVSVGYLKENGLYKNLDFERYNFRSNLDFQVTNNLKVSLDLGGRLENRSGPAVTVGSFFSGLLRLSPTSVAYYDNGLPGPGAFGGNPIEQMRNGGVSTSTRNIFLGTLKGEYDIPFVKGLKLIGYASVDRAQIHSKSLERRYSYFSLNNGEYDETIAGQSSLGESYFNGPASSGSGIPDPTLTLNTTLNYAATIADRHDVTLLLGVEKARHESNSFSAGRLNLVSNSLPQLNFGDAESSTTGGSAFSAARLGYLARATYAFDSKYLFEASFRYDASENFAEANRWGFFPSFSAGWRISEESFFSGLTAIDNLKLRGSWGQLGNDRISQFQFLNAFNFGGDYIIGGGAVKTIRPGVVPNPDVTWETATSTNIGFNLGLFESKITVEADYFVKKTSDILEFRDLSVPSTFGASLPRQNIGKVDNKGFELSLQHRNTIGEFDYWVKSNYTFARNKIVFKDEPESVADNIRLTGRPIGAFFGYQAIGLFQTQDEVDAHADQGNVAPGDIKYADINQDDVINGEDRVYLGNINAVDGQAAPEVIYALAFGARYKGLDLSVQFQGADNFDTYLSHEGAWAFFNGGKVMEQHLDRWTPDNRDASYPRILTEDSNNRLQSSYWIRDASYLRLKNVELGYNLPVAILEKANLSNVRFYVSGLNLLTFSQLDTFDPEAPNGRGWFYPQQKSFTIGVSVQL